MLAYTVSFELETSEIFNNFVCTFYCTCFDCYIWEETNSCSQNSSNFFIITSSKHSL